MKDIIFKKRFLEDKTIKIFESFSVIIPCEIGDRTFQKPLIDINACVRAMPLPIYKKSVIKRVSDTRMTLLVCR